jgi:hypothetical protein
MFIPNSSDKGPNLGVLVEQKPQRHVYREKEDAEVKLDFDEGIHQRCLVGRIDDFADEPLAQAQRRKAGDQLVQGIGNEVVRKVGSGVMPGNHHEKDAQEHVLGDVGHQPPETVLQQVGLA